MSAPEDGEMDPTAQKSSIRYDFTVYFGRVVQ